MINSSAGAIGSHWSILGTLVKSNPIMPLCRTHKAAYKRRTVIVHVLTGMHAIVMEDQTGWHSMSMIAKCISAMSAIGRGISTMMGWRITCYTLVTMGFMPTSLVGLRYWKYYCELLP